MSKLVALRIPDELAEKLASRCSIHKRSMTDVLLEAIGRGWRDSGPVAQLAERGTHNAKVSGSIPDRTTKPTIADLRSICDGNVSKAEIEPELDEDVTPECCECGRKLTGKVVKGVVVAWACPDAGCAMYGIEQR